MEILDLLDAAGLGRLGFLWSPFSFAILIAGAVYLVWASLAPVRQAQSVEGRLDGYLERSDASQDDEMRRPFASRALVPVVRWLLTVLGRVAPKRNAEMTRRMLMQANEPFGLSVLDFFGLRLLSCVLLGGAAFWILGRGRPFATAAEFAVVAALLGYLLPMFWLRGRVRRRRHQIARALPDALDMLTIGVEAGLAFESALLQVGEKWHNPLTQEFRRAVAEMRVGAPREEALKRMAERAGDPDLSTFVAVLIQSHQLGVSIAQVLHGQAAAMRTKRRQRAEELARQAGTKMVFPLVFLVFPAIFVVILGPAVPTILSALRNLAGTGRP